MKMYLGIDVGSSVVKAALVDETGAEIAVASERTNLSSPHPGWVEIDPEQVWRATVGVITKLIGDNNQSWEIRGVGVSGAGNGLLLLDEHGRPCRPFIGASDTRSAVIVDRWAGDGRAMQRRAITRQVVWSGQPAPLLSWLSENEPGSLADAKHIVFIKDYINAKLTGQIGTDLGTISGSGLLDISRRVPPAELFAAYDLPGVEQLICAPRESTDVIGSITPEASEVTGLRAGTPVIAGLYDIDASAVGSGVVTPRVGSLVAGTWSMNAALVDNLPSSDELFMTKCSAVPGLWMALEGSATSVVNLDWIAPMLLGNEAGIHDRLEAMVTDPGLKPTSIIFHPFAFGGSDFPAARAGFLGAAAWHTKAQLIQAVYEGITFGHLEHVDRLRAAEVPIDSFRFTGGGSRSVTWSQMFADVLGARVEVPRAHEVGALGAAMCAAIGVGDVGSFAEAAKSMTSVSRTHEPNSTKADYYRERFAIWRESLMVLRPIWTRLAALEG